MYRRILLGVAVAVACVVVSDRACASGNGLNGNNNDEPSPRLQKFLIERLTNQIQAADHIAVIKSIRSILKTNKDDKFKQLNKWFVGMGNSSLDRLLLESRLAAGKSSGQIPKPNIDEMLVMVPLLQADIQRQIKEIGSLPILNDPLVSPEGLDEFESMLWDSEQAKNLVSGTIKNVELAQGWIRQTEKQAKQNNKLAPKQLELLNPDWADKLHDQFSALDIDIVERLAEVRYFRMEDSVALIQKSPIKVDQLRAALLIQRDEKFLRETIEQKQNKFVRPNLRDGLLKQNLDEITAEAQLSGADLIEKARLLDEGIYWWLRGRYGFAQLGGGLLKVPPAAGDEQLQRAIFMPSQKPVPTSPTTLSNDGESVPYYRRRHFYNWAVEYRPKYERSSTSTRTSYNRSVSTNMLPKPIVTSEVLNCGGHKYTRVTTTHGSKTRTVTAQSTSVQTHVSKLAPKDKSMYSRLVGSYEYEKALRAFEAFVEKASEDEIEAADRIVEKMPELDIFTNLSRFAEPSGAILIQPQTKPGDDFRRQGLAWLMAFARLELASNLAAYTQTTDPFLNARPTIFEVEAYADLIFDALRTHYYAMSQDNFFKFILARNFLLADSDSAAYVRRLNLVIELLKTTILFYGEMMNQSEQQELTQWKKNIDDARDYLDSVIPEKLTMRATAPIQHNPVTNSYTRQLKSVRNLPHNR